MIQEVLLDLHKAREHLEDLAQLADDEKEKHPSQSFAVKVGENAAAARERLNRVHDYLMESFSSPVDEVLHRVQVCGNQGWEAGAVLF